MSDNGYHLRTDSARDYLLSQAAGTFRSGRGDTSASVSDIVGDAVNDRHNNAWVVVVMDRMRPVVGMLFVVLSVAAWGLLMWAVRQTLMAGYVADAVARGGG